MKPKNFYRIIIGILMIISGIASLILTVGEVIIGTILLVAGLAFLITGITRHRKYEDEPESDERSKKIGSYGLSYAWLTGLLFLPVLAGLSENTQAGDASRTRRVHYCSRTLRPALPVLAVP